jgi:TPR repeat protein
MQSLRDAAEMYLEITSKIFSQFYFNSPLLFDLEKQSARSNDDGVVGFLKSACYDYLQNDFLFDIGEIRKYFPHLASAAERGEREAHFLIGRAYHLGTGVPKNSEAAFKWISISAEKGCSEAQIYLGNMYKNGDGVPKDLNEAAKWFRMAGELTERPELKII